MGGFGAELTHNLNRDIKKVQGSNGKEEDTWQGRNGQGVKGHVLTERCPWGQGKAAEVVQIYEIIWT